MAVTLTSSGITFSDGNSQNTVASGMPTTSNLSSQFNSSGNFTPPSTGIGVWVFARPGGFSGGREFAAGQSGASFGFVPTNSASGSTPYTVGNGGVYNQTNVPGNPTTYSNFIGPSGNFSFGSLEAPNGLISGGTGGNRRSPGGAGAIRFLNFG